MPVRNVIKEYAAENYYHIYARGSNKQKIFLEAADYNYFISLFARYLSAMPVLMKSGEPYPNYKTGNYALCVLFNGEPLSYLGVPKGTRLYTEADAKHYDEL